MKKIFFQDGIIYESYHLSNQDAKDGVNETAPRNQFNLSEREIQEINKSLKKFLNSQGKIIKKIDYKENNLIVYELISGCVKKQIFLFKKNQILF